MRRVLACIATIVAVLAFLAAVVLAYVGALTDDVHAWQCWLVTAGLTVAAGVAAAALWPL